MSYADVIQKLFTFKDKAVKQATLMLFFFLPSRLTKVFVSVSLLLLIYNLREKKLTEDVLTVEFLKETLKVKVDDSVLLLPKKTLNWYWPEQLMKTKITTLCYKQRTIEEILLNNDLLMHNRSIVINVLLKELPRTIKLKLGLYNVNKRIRVKNDMINVLLHKSVV